MLYTIRHVTKFSYERAISESVMEARMQPRSEGRQRCVRFGLSTTPSSRVRMYQDHDGNIVHHFDIPGRVSRLTVTAEALVECDPSPELPPALTSGAWERLDASTEAGRFWDYLRPSPFARPTALLEELAADIALTRGEDPLGMIRLLSADLFERFEYSPRSTRVDSPIDHALESRRGVCQDFAHITIALVRQLGVPCRYVSGYLFHSPDEHVRSTDGATHAWVEAWHPDFDWVGFDPTNNLMAGDGHIRVAVGRDYADVPPTRGVFKGRTAVRSELAVAVRVGTARGSAVSDEVPSFVPWMSREAAPPASDAGSDQQQQQQ
jgi:transglutaminase-like putative cysteine protease